ncbi:MAG: methylated-DNA--[protein]-cysteine S-methyltransferase [Bacteroidota bacterium]
MPSTVSIQLYQPNKRLYYDTYQTSLGTVLLVGNEEAIVALHFLESSVNKHLDVIEQRLERYPLCDPAIMQTHWQKIIHQKSYQLALQGTHFQQKVWEKLLTIPAGTRCSYQRLASLLGTPKSTRAVANAIGRNNIAYCIPCHRIVRSDGSLGGYRWRITIKEKLLIAETSNCTSSLWECHVNSVQGFNSKVNQEHFRSKLGLY